MKIYKLTLLFSVVVLFCVNTTDLAGQTKEWVIPEEVANLKNPVQVSPEVLKRGKVLYSQFCVMCHGTTGVVEGNMATMNPAPTNLTTEAFHNQKDGVLYYKIRTGKPPKPSFEKHMTEEDTWKLLHYLRTLKAKK